MKTWSKILTGGAHIPAFRQECWQILSQWVWNLRLEFGQHCSPLPLRTTVFASASEPAPASASALGTDSPSTSEPAYGPPQWARPSFTGGFPGSAFLPQPDGTLLCPAGHVLAKAERREERAGSVRVSYAACLDDCRLCPFRCQGQRTFDPFRQLEMDPPREYSEKDAFFLATNVQRGRLFSRGWWCSRGTSFC